MRYTISLVVILQCACTATPEAADVSAKRVALVEEFRRARAAGELEAARSYQGEDPRIWYDTKVGEGKPWTAGGGRWKEWDAHFRGTSELISPWQSDADRVWADLLETNDYFKLTDSKPGAWRCTYFLDEDDRITGVMISAVPDAAANRGRRDEFEAWAREHRPKEAEYLMPGGSLDPTGDRAPRMRALLNEWRAAVGLAELTD